MSSAQLLMIKGAIAELTAEEQAKVAACAEQLRQAIKASGDYGLIALALVGAETEETAGG